MYKKYSVYEGRPESKEQWRTDPTPTPSIAIACAPVSYISRHSVS